MRRMPHRGDFESAGMDKAGYRRTLWMELTGTTADTGLFTLGMYARRREVSRDFMYA